MIFPLAIGKMPIVSTFSMLWSLDSTEKERERELGKRNVDLFSYK